MIVVFPEGIYLLQKYICDLLPVKIIMMLKGIRKISLNATILRMIINCTPLKSTFLLMLRRTEWNVMDVSQFVKAENEPENISGLEFNKRYQHPCAPP